MARTLGSNPAGNHQDLCEGVFDDADFYQQLLTELISSQPENAVAAYSSNMRRTKKQKKVLYYSLFCSSS
jgi:hypothetical protein